MLLYEYHIRDEFNRVREYAANLRTKFQEGVDPAELLRDTQNLKALYEHLRDLLPESIRQASNFARHLGWMGHRLGEGSPDLCRADIDDICDHDLPELESGFRDWCAESVHYDSELVEKVSGLLIHREYDSAIRKGFVILKERLCAKFNADRSTDGVDLVNTIFGSNGRPQPCSRTIDVRHCETCSLGCTASFATSMATKM